MKQELDSYLCSKYPKIFAERHGSPRDTCMCWGFSCEDGWFHLLNNLCASIQSHIDHLNKYEPGKVEQVIALQVKEKFSSLRFYYSGGDDIIQGMVRLAEDLSYHICEKCGKFDHTVSRNSSGWIKTTCSDCFGKPDQIEEHKANQNKELLKLFENK